MTKRASWQRQWSVLNTTVQFGNGGETTPQYWNCNFTFAPNPENLRRTHRHNEIIHVEFKANIQAVDPSIQYIGILGAYLGYPPVPPTTPNIDLGAPQIPSPPTLDPRIDAVEYDPTNLPVGGVDFPIWQRKVVDPLHADHFLTPQENPHALVGFVLIQVTGSTFVNPAATVLMQHNYDLDD